MEEIRIPTAFGDLVAVPYEGQDEKDVFDGIQIYLCDASNHYERTIVTVVEEGGRLIRYESDIYGEADNWTDMTGE
jgi:hypothetical protein